MAACAGPAPQKHLFIFSAPSGAGKSTLCSALLNHFDDLAYSVSYTTRPPRQGEIHGKDYFFVTRNEFEDGIRKNLWAEWAQVHGHFYGTSAQWIRQALQEGRDVLLDIDVQGKNQLIRQFPDAVTLFIMPPSLSELERRLRQRGSSDEAELALRLKNARDEIAQKESYRHILINDDLDQTIADLVALIDTYRSGSFRPA